MVSLTPISNSKTILPQGQYVLQLEEVEVTQSLPYDEMQKHYAAYGNYPTEEEMNAMPDDKKEPKWIFVFKTFKLTDQGELEDLEYEVKRYTSAKLNIFKGTPSNALRIIGALTSANDLASLQNKPFESEELEGKYVSVTVLKTADNGVEKNIFEGWQHYDPLKKAVEVIEGDTPPF